MSQVRKRAVDSSASGSKPATNDEATTSRYTADDDRETKVRGKLTASTRPSSTADHEGAIGLDNRCRLQPGSYWLTRIVFTRAIGFIYFVAFMVALHQNKQLLGSNRLLPILLYFTRLRNSRDFETQPVPNPLSYYGILRECFQLDQKIQDPSVLFINMHHLVNKFRPHQARETLRVIMERQKKQREDMISQVQRATEKARSILKECTDTLVVAAGSIPDIRRLVVVGEMGGADDVAIVKTSTVGDEKTRHKVSSLSRTQQFVERQDSELCTLIDSLISAPIT